MKLYKIMKDGVQSNAAPFETQVQADEWISKNKSSFPEGYTVETEDVTKEIETAAVIDHETKVDQLCHSAYKIFKRHNRKNFQMAYVQAFFASADALKFYVMLDGGSPALAKQYISAGILAGYPSELLADMGSFLNAAETLSSQEQ